MSATGANASFRPAIAIPGMPASSGPTAASECVASSSRNPRIVVTLVSLIIDAWKATMSCREDSPSSSASWKTTVASVGSTSVATLRLSTAARGRMRSPARHTARTAREPSSRVTPCRENAPTAPFTTTIPAMRRRTASSMSLTPANTVCAPRE